MIKISGNVETLQKNVSIATSQYSGVLRNTQRWGTGGGCGLFLGTYIGGNKIRFVKTINGGGVIPHDSPPCVCL